jgi:hypothetical protein
VLREIIDQRVLTYDAGYRVPHFAQMTVCCMRLSL